MNKSTGTQHLLRADLVAQIIHMHPTFKTVTVSSRDCNRIGVLLIEPQNKTGMAMALPAAAVILAVFADVSLAVLVQPKIPPRGFNSFDLQYDRRANPSIPIWNESYFRKIAPVIARQLLPAGCKLTQATLPSTWGPHGRACAPSNATSHCGRRGRSPQAVPFASWPGFHCSQRFNWPSPHPDDTIVIDGGWHQPISPNGFPMPDPERWPSASGGKGFKPLADWTHSLGLKFGESPRRADSREGDVRGV